MTLDELNKIHDHLVYHTCLPRCCSALDIVKREIELKTINPQTGKLKREYQKDAQKGN